MIKREKKYFDLAKATAKCSEHPEFHIGAVLINKKQIISVSFNLIKSHPLQKKLNRYRFKPHDRSKDFLHAELAAICKANVHSLRGASLYVYREDKNGIISCCRPCPACMTKIKEVGIKHIYYTIKDGFCHEQISRTLE